MEREIPHKIRRPAIGGGGAFMRGTSSPVYEEVLGVVAVADNFTGRRDLNWVPVVFDLLGIRYSLNQIEFIGSHRGFLLLIAFVVCWRGELAYLFAVISLFNF